MTKRLKLTKELKAKITNAVGDEVEFSKLAVYEAVAASTRPISQTNSPYDGAVLSESYLSQMVDYLEQESVPIQVMHDNTTLPIGKVVDAAVVDADSGTKDLNVIFYVEADSDYAAKIDLGIIDEVSIGSLPAHALCSECGYDYAEKGNEFSFFFRECENGHVIGENGCHLRLTKMAKWGELSLVGKGASDKPKILGSAKQRLSKENYDKLAASGFSPETIQFAYLSCSATSPKKLTDIEDLSMDLSQLTTQISELSAAKAKLEVTQQQVEEQLTQANTKLEAANTRIDELTEALKAASDTELQSKLEDLESKLADANKAMTFLDEQVKLACKAAGLSLADDADLEAKIDLLEQAQVKLAAIPRGGVLQGADGSNHDDSSGVLYVANQAFISRN